MEAAREIRKDEDTRTKAYWAKRTFAVSETEGRFLAAIANAFSDPATGRSLFGDAILATVDSERFTLAALYEKDTKSFLGVEVA